MFKKLKILRGVTRVKLTVSAVLAVLSCVIGYGIGLIGGWAVGLSAGLALGSSVVWFWLPLALLRRLSSVEEGRLELGKVSSVDSLRLQIRGTDAFWIKFALLRMASRGDFRTDGFVRDVANLAVECKLGHLGSEGCVLVEDEW